MMGKRKTVYERSQENGGYIDGGQNRMVQNAVKKAPAVEEAETGPPGYRDAFAQVGSCSRCGNFAKGRCEMHDTDVDPDMVCDDYAKVGAAAAEESEEMESESEMEEV